ncbi:MAG TPA: hypothetical protein VNL71_02250, partial [Chloroflexota bacterium]|nr:hypothetical protein [Chloroflexota bacterium]
MIVKQHFGANFRALMAYLLDQDQDGHAEARIFETNIGYRDPEILLDSLEYYAGLRPRISKPVWHVILALTEDERARLDDFQAHALPSRFFAAMGITRIPFVAVRHEEGLHIMASTVDLDGRPVNLWRSIQRGRDAARTIAPDFGLDTPTRPGPFPLPALTRGEMELALRCAYGQGLPPPKYALAAAIILALEPGTHHPQTFAANLDRLGVEVSFHTTPEGVINGARYTLRDASGPMAASLTGSKIGHGYTWSH